MSPNSFSQTTTEVFVAISVFFNQKKKKYELESGLEADFADSFLFFRYNLLISSEVRIVEKTRLLLCFTSFFLFFRETVSFVTTGEKKSEISILD